MPDWDLLQQPEPDFEFDQRVTWSPPSLSQGTVQPLSSAGGTLRRRCSPQHPRDAGACTARDLRQTRCRALTAHPTPSNLLFRASRHLAAAPEPSAVGQCPESNQGLLYRGFVW